MDALEQKQLREAWQAARRQVGNLETALTRLRADLESPSLAPPADGLLNNQIASHEQRLSDARALVSTYESQLVAAGIPEYEWSM